MTQQHNPIDRPTQPTRSDAPTDGPADEAAPTVPAHVSHYHAADPEPAFGPPAVPGDLGRLAHYRVRKLLGKGGMGAVYLGIDQGLRRKVALKVMLPRAAADPAAKDRFKREARAAAAVKHDNVVTIYQVGEDRGTPYIAMEYLSGYSLDGYLRKAGRLSIPQVLRVGREAAAGLAAAHALGLIHRDIKPANLWLEAPNGRIKILDFGLAKATADRRAPELTGSGDVVGTPQFMAPEQARGAAIDHRVDIFSLGAVLYWLATGQLPFAGSTVMAVLTSLAVDEPPPVLAQNPTVPPALADLIHRMLAKRPEDRPQSADEVLTTLRAIRRGPGEPSIEGGGTGPTAPYVSIPIEATESNAFAGLGADDPPAPSGITPGRHHGRHGLWVAVAAAAAATAALGYYAYTLIPRSPPPAPPPRWERGEPRPVPPKPARPEDPTRQAAEWALKAGGTVVVDTADAPAIADAAKLPTRAFRLVALRLPEQGPPARDADLEPLRHLDNLDILDLGPAEISDRGLEALASFPFASRLTTLALPCAGLTEAGMAQLTKFRGLGNLTLTKLARPTPAGLAHVGTLTELTGLTISGATLSPGVLAPLRGTKLSHLSLPGCTVPVGGLDGLRDIPTLTFLQLGHAKLSGPVLKSLAGHPALAGLSFGGAVPDDALTGLRDLPALHNLYVNAATIGDTGIAHLAGLTAIRTLSLPSCRLADTAMPTINRLTTLEQLDLQNVAITDAGVRQLTGLNNLRTLRLDGTRISDDSMPILAGLPRLNSVHLTNVSITDAGLAKLVRGKFLYLHLGGTRVSAPGVAKLKAALPDCQIQSDFDLPK